MKEKVAKNALIVTGITFFVGLILIFSSTSIGESFGQNALDSNGGMMNTPEYERIITENTQNFRIGGLVLSLVGGLGSLLSGYALYNEIDKDSIN